MNFTKINKNYKTKMIKNYKQKMIKIKLKNVNWHFLIY